MEEKTEKNLLKKSEELIASIIIYLVPNGVKKVGIGPHQLLQANLDVPDSLLFRDAMDWLIEENIVRYDQKYSSLQYYGCCITSHGFALLGQKFIGSDGGETVGKAVKNVSENNASYSKMGDLLGGILGGFTKTIGS